MPGIEVRNNESLERALKRFKKKIQREGILKQYRSREFYEKPSTKRRRKRKEAVKKAIREKTGGDRTGTNRIRANRKQK